MFWSKIFNTKYDILVAICDEELLEKTIDKKLNIRLKKEFYGGKLIDEKIAIRIMEKATIGNLFGKKIVELAEKNGFITRKNVILINGIPHAQFVKL